MRLSWRDGVETLQVVLLVMVLVGVIEDREWSLSGTARAATGTLFALGFVMCQIGRGRITSGRDLVRGAFMTAASLLRVAALALTIVGLTAPGKPLAFAVGSILIATSVLATVHHASEPRPAPVVR